MSDTDSTSEKPDEPQDRIRLVMGRPNQPLTDEDIKAFAEEIFKAIKSVTRQAAPDDIDPKQP